MFASENSCSIFKRQTILLFRKQYKDNMKRCTIGVLVDPSGALGKRTLHPLPRPRPFRFCFHFHAVFGEIDLVVVPKCFIKHMCFIVLYFHGHAFFSLEIAKKCFFVLYFCKLFKWLEYLFQVFIYNTKIGEL